MKNLVQQEGNLITVIAPSGGVVSGTGVLIGDALFGISTVTADAGASVEIVTEGVFTLAKTSTAVIAIGDIVYWDDTNKVVNVTATGQVPVGVALSAAGNPSATVKVKLGVYIAASG